MISASFAEIVLESNLDQDSINSDRTIISLLVIINGTQNNGPKNITPLGRNLINKKIDHISVIKTKGRITRYLKRAVDFE